MPKQKIKLLRMEELDKIPAPGDVEKIVARLALSASVGLLKTQVEQVIYSLNDLERKVLQLRFGLTDGKSRTIEQVAAEMEITKERVRQIEARALRKLRHPSKSEKIKEYLE